jgi:RimJ/RimL family protein N-acetyltransferase
VPSLPGSLTLRDGDLELRRLAASDRDAIVAACQDPEIRRWTTLPDPFTMGAVDELLEEADARWSDGSGVELAILRDGRFPGATHLVFYGDWRASVAYWLAPEGRGAGLATRAVKLLVRRAFGTFDDLVRVELWSIVGNEASDAVARRAGFVEEGVLRSRLPYRGSHRDVRCFSLLRGEEAEAAG